MTRGLLLVLLFMCTLKAGEHPYLEYVRAEAKQLRGNDPAPRDAEAWRAQAANVRRELREAWGGMEFEKVPLTPKVLGTIEREGYRIEKVIFQTFPGIFMTANAYVPKKEGRSPALLMVHGHWRGAKQDPVVQARCIGAVKLGFFVLVVDAFGAGERGVGKALGEYHGEMTAATLLPVGLPLSGLQVHENMRAVDYLQSRAEVDAGRIGITGASGGGNQTMYAAGWDERFAAAAPVCSVGNYQAYLGAACCMCEVVPGALRFTEEWAVLGLVAPRGLMVINATRDARQFSVEEAQISLAKTKEVFRALGVEGKLRQTVFESGHDYSAPMREAMYGWMAAHLKEGNGEPIAEGEIQTEEPESLRCFPGGSRPEDWVTVPKFAAREGRRLLKAPRKLVPEQLPQRREELRKALGGPKEKGQPNPVWENKSELAFSIEPNIRVRAKVEGEVKGGNVILVVHAGENVPNQQGKGVGAVVTYNLSSREQGWPGDKIGQAPDHTTAQWGLWIGRPLVGEWAADLSRLLDALGLTEAGQIEVQAVGSAGMAAIIAAALDDRIDLVRCEGLPGTYLTEKPYEGWRMANMIPGILRKVGDVADVAALCAPKRLTLENPVGPQGKPLKAAEAHALFERTRAVYQAAGQEDRFQLGVE